MKRKLLLLVCAVLGMLQAKAYSTSDLTSAGWTEVTSTSTLSSGVNSSVYVIVDAGGGTYFVAKGANDDARPKYVALANPFSTPEAVWTFESRGTNKYAIRNLSSNYYFNSAANGWQDFMNPTWTGSGTFDFAYADSKFKLTNSSVTEYNQNTEGQYVGPWDNNLSSVTSVQDVACNKKASNAPGFKIYAISRSNYAKEYAKASWASSASLDLTFLIVNPNIYHTGARGNMPTGGWATFGEQSSNGNRVTDNSSTNDVKLEGWKSNSESGMKIDYMQEIASLSDGKYSVTAKAWDQHQTGGELYIYSYSTGDKLRKSMPETEADISTDYILVTSSDPRITIGMQIVDKTGTWITTDNYRLSYKPYITAVASPYPSDGGLAAETWYVYTIPMTGDYYFSATSGVVYTTSGNQEAYSASTTPAASKISFTKDEKVYVKSTSAQTVKLQGKFYLSTTVNGITKWLNKNESNITYVKDHGLEFIVTKDAEDYYSFQCTENDLYVADQGSSWVTKISDATNNKWQLELTDGKYKLKLKQNLACLLEVHEPSTGLVELSRSVDNGYYWSFVTPDDYANYAALVDINDKITAVGELPYADSEKKPSVLNASSASDAASKVTSQTTALRTYVESNAMGEGVSATDYSYKITNATCPGPKTATDKEYSSADGWDLTYVRFDGGEGWTGSATSHDVYYGSNGYFWGNYAGSRNSSMQQVISDLPTGKYLLTVRARSSGTVPTLYISANGTIQNITNPNGVFGNRWDDTSVLFTVGSDGKATIRLQAQKESDGTMYRWYNADNFRLVRIGNLDAVTLDEDENEIATIVAKNADVTLNRTFNANWATFVVPFDIDNTTLKEQFGDDVRVSEFSADDKTGVTFTPMAEPAITANKPVLMKTNTEQSSFTFDGVEIKEATPTFSQAGVNFVGNYAGEITIPNELDTYFVKSNALKKSTGTQKLKGFRAYFTVDADSPVKAFFENGFNFDDAVGIKAIDNGQLTIDNAEIFNLAGQKMSKLQKGVNIVNGKKVLVK